MNQALQDRKLGSTENDKSHGYKRKDVWLWRTAIANLSWSLSLPTSLVNQVNSSRRQNVMKSLIFSFLSVESHLAQGSSQLPSLGRGDQGRVCTRMSIFYFCIELSEWGIL